MASCRLSAGGMIVILDVATALLWVKYVLNFSCEIVVSVDGVCLGGQHIAKPRNELRRTVNFLMVLGGAASAVEMSWGGNAEVFYDVDGENIYGSADVDFTLSQELNNGATISLSQGFDIFPCGWCTDGLPTLVLETSYGTISAGEVDNVNEEAFSEVSGMALTEDDFGTWTHHISATSSLGGFDIAASTDSGVNNVAFNVTGSTGAVDFGIYYETDIMGATASTTVGALSLDFGYASGFGETSMGIGAGYDISSTLSASASFASNTVAGNATAVGVAYDNGSITAEADYAVEAGVLDLEAGYTTEVQPGMTVSVGVRVADATGTSTTDYNADVAYVSGDLTLLAGYDSADGSYAGVDYDLGGGVTAWAHYTEYDEAGPSEWDGAETRIGLTAEF